MKCQYPETASESIDRVQLATDVGCNNIHSSNTQSLLQVPNQLCVSFIQSQMAGGVHVATAGVKGDVGCCCCHGDVHSVAVDPSNGVQTESTRGRSFTPTLCYPQCFVVQFQAKVLWFPLGISLNGTKG